jgi:HPt (histidine-containing phosphotransfer) domain-containing protein
MKECCATYLNEQFGGDADVVNEIYGEYASSAKAKTSEAEAALAAGEWDALDKIAHTVKGNALAAGDNETAQVGIDLRRAAQLKDATVASPLVEQLKVLTAAL